MRPELEYDRGRVTVGVVHFGVGGFHRSHQAMFHDRLLSAGEGLDWGICGVGVMGPDREMRDALLAQDCEYTLVLKHPDGRYVPQVIGSIVEYRFAPDDGEATVERMADPQVRIVSLTVTEGGYTPLEGDPMAFALIAEALVRRRARDVPPFTVMSCDNVEANGEAARAALVAVAQLRGGDLAEWIAREVAFPSSMVDRITPVTSEDDRAEMHRRFGIEDRCPVVAEPFVQWVLEDRFPTGRPPYEHVGVQLVEDVRPYELMKMRLLNGSHQALAYLGYLCGHRFVDETMQDPVLRAFVLRYMDEVTPTLDPVRGVDLDDYKQTLLSRFGNAHVRDTLARVGAMTSDRIPKFVLPAVRDNLAAGRPIDAGALVVASWVRYARGFDEQGDPIAVVDTLRDELMAAAQGSDPRTFLVAAGFGDLGYDERFVAAYETALAALDEHGARASMERLA
ncbi:MAG: mannitol 2-dehydrogenase [Solirubrobacteraceae bacterium]|nr:mannitol 2-dehydrogenase [Solirubrobacteraceae bacterium]